MHLEDDVLVFVVDPVVGDDGADELADQALRIGVSVADAQRGIGVFGVRVEGIDPLIIFRALAVSGAANRCWFWAHSFIGTPSGCVNFGTVLGPLDFG